MTFLALTLSLAGVAFVVMTVWVRAPGLRDGTAHWREVRRQGGRISP